MLEASVVMPFVCSVLCYRVMTSLAHFISLKQPSPSERTDAHCFEGFDLDRMSL
jgi:hypothetical protein